MTGIYAADFKILPFSSMQQEIKVDRKCMDGLGLPMLLIYGKYWLFSLITFLC